MWVRHVSRSRGKPYLVHAVSGETKWCAPSTVGRAYDGAMVAGGSKDGGSEDGIQARRAHNRWKRDLISAHVRPGDAGRDLAGGRGGDLAKMGHAGAASYVGGDVADGFESAFGGVIGAIGGIF